jgi:putative DNA primase/helicase
MKTSTGAESEYGEALEQGRKQRRKSRGQSAGNSGTSILPPPSSPMPVARLFVELHGQRDGVLTIHCWGGAWWAWQTTHWTEVDERSVRARLYQFTENAWYLDAKGNPTPWAPTRRKIGDLLEALAAIAILPEDFAQPRWLDSRCTGQIVAVANGLLDIDRRQLYPHTPLYFSTVSVPFAFDATTPQPQHFLEFLNELWPQEPEAVDALGEWFGYVISGRTNLQKMLFMVGPTRGGKGVLARLLTRLLGSANVCGPTLSSFAGEFGLAPLFGKSLAIISDVRFSGKGASTVVERLLSISGEDTLTINRKFREQIDTKMSTRMHLMSNEMPRLTDASGAIIGRFIVFLLTRSWLGKEDTELELRLCAELPGILNFALEGLARLNNNSGRFTRIPSAEEAIVTMRDLASPVAAFVRERCKLDAQASTAVDELYAVYKTWCEDNEYPRASKHVFGRDLRAACPLVRKERPRHRPGESRRDQMYVGIRWLKEGEDEDDALL